MLSSLSPRRLARSSAEHPKRTLALWGGLLAASIVATALLLTGALTTQNGFTGSPESKRADQLIAQRFGAPQHDVETIVVGAPAGTTIASPAVRSTVEGLAAKARALGTAKVLTATTYYDTKAPQLIAKDLRTTIIPVTMAGDVNDARVNIAKLRSAVMAADGTDGVSARITGEAAVGADTADVSKSDLQIGEAIGIPVALIILLLVFRSGVAAAVPLALSGAAIVLAIGATALIGSISPLSFFVVNMITMMGLAVGVDYSLFIVSRYRDERALGVAKLDAIEIAASTAGRAVAFSGITVVVALVGMLLVPTLIFISLAVGAIAVVLAAVAASMTLLPAVLGLLGNRIESLRLPFLPQGQASEGPFWSRIVGAVMRRPGLFLTGGVAVLLIAATPYLNIHTGTAGLNTLPNSMPSKQAYQVLQRDFSAGTVAPVEIALDGNASTPAAKAAVARLSSTLAATPLLGRPAVQTSPGGDLVRLSVPLNAPSTSSQAQDAVKHLRSTVLPAALAGSGLTAYVGGTTAGNLDFFAITDRYLPIVVGLVLLLSFIVLMIAFRSIVVPLTAIAMNLLSVGAAYGLLVLVSQEGYGAGLLGFRQVSTVEAWIPLFLFSILFGLSMDYHVFLLSRIKERYDRTGDTAESVRYGIASSGQLITGAALIMVAVFAGFAAGDMVMFQQMGFGLAVAVLIDATLVRSILVPATMRLLGDANWYLPGFLSWLPRIEIEGPAAEAQPALGD